MKRASLALCAVVGVVALLAGCNSLDLGLDLGLAAVDAAAEVRILDGSPDTVAPTLVATLKQRGLEANIVKTADTVVVESKTAAGLRFGLVLKSQRGSSGQEQTNIALTWMDNRKDQQTSVQIFTELDRQGAKK